jgi:hypothetical protein
MNDELGSIPDILGQLESMTNKGQGVSHQDFERLLEEGSASIPVSRANQLLDFAGDQVGFWEAEWLFSPAHSPNTNAKTEMEGWRLLWQALLESLSETVPDIRELTEKTQQLKILQHHSQRGLEFNETKPFRKYTAPVLSKLSLALNKIGLRSIAKNLYVWSLYPKGTVARP